MKRSVFGVFQIVKLLTGMIFMKWSLLLVIPPMERLTFDSLVAFKCSGNFWILQTFTTFFFPWPWSRMHLFGSEGCIGGFTQGELPLVWYFWYESLSLSHDRTLYVYLQFSDVGTIKYFCPSAIGYSFSVLLVSLSHVLLNFIWCN